MQPSLIIRIVVSAASGERITIVVTVIADEFQRRRTCGRFWNWITVDRGKRFELELEAFGDRNRPTFRFREMFGEWSSWGCRMLCVSVGVFTDKHNEHPPLLAILAFVFVSDAAPDWDFHLPLDEPSLGNKRNGTELVWIVSAVELFVLIVHNQRCSLPNHRTYTRSTRI
ncbi:hypothetical protein BLNAU_21312 [Blattamonas nauphoetae]|uniref:Uncharacterized protein n=1 Tax=Blattamonas nauphoetae TaxID=2049346 RepID=A0ABQ9WW97_9EUKA|nr:hypothetical protein BLNAU_21312 [Blattamonas nauphoetae]